MNDGIDCTSSVQGIVASILFDTVAEQTRQLVECDAALVVLDCPIPALRHPLLALLPAVIAPASRCYGTRPLAALLKSEDVRIVCDIACQSGSLQWDLFPSPPQYEQATWYIGSIPIDGPRGILGYILLSSTPAECFGEGERALLRDYLQIAYKSIEAELLELITRQLSHLAFLACEHPTPQQAGELQLQHSVQSALSSISMVGHELRTPLAAIKGYAALLQTYSVADAQQAEQEQKEALLHDTHDTTMTPARQQRYLDMIMEETHRLETLITDVLDLSRLQSGKLSIHFQDVDVRDLCQQAVRVARQRLSHKIGAEYDIACHLPEQLPLMWADPQRLRQVLDNLLDNAIKYSPAGGKIEVTVSLSSNQSQPEQQDITIVVRDEGVGISATQQDRLFQAFSRVEHAGISQVGGVGLGLYITRQLVEAMQGSIRLSSQEGKGTEITLSFPPKSFLLLTCRMVENAGMLAYVNI